MRRKCCEEARAKAKLPTEIEVFEYHPWLALTNSMRRLITMTGPSMRVGSGGRCKVRSIEMKMQNVLSVFIWLTICLGSSQSTHARATGAGFDYYVLSLYWLPTLCLEAPGDDVCHGARHDGFVVHGLLPSRTFGSPVNCPSDAVISNSLVDQMKDLLGTRKLVEREWAAHGSCSGLSPDQFFVTLRKAYQSVTIPPLSAFGGTSQTTAHDMIKAFTRRDPGLFPQAVSVTCSGNPPRLQEVRICLSKNLASDYCRGEIIQSSCRQPSVALPLPP